jgi:hypothetical protein
MKFRCPILAVFFLATAFRLHGQEHAHFIPFDLKRATIAIPDYMEPCEAPIGKTLIMFKSKNINYYTIIAIKEVRKKNIKPKDSILSPEAFARNIANALAQHAEGRACTQSPPKVHTEGNITFAEIEISCEEKRQYYDEATYYHVGVAATADGFYSVSCTTPLPLKNMFKDDFSKILHSIKSKKK